MPEVRPHLTYSADGTLTVNRSEPEHIANNGVGCNSSFKVNRHLEYLRDKSVESLSGLPGVVVDDQQGQLRITVAEALEEALSGDGAESQDFLMNITVLGSSGNYKDKTDRMLSFSTYTQWATRVVVYPQFQSWLNEEGLSNLTAAEECIAALALPFGYKNQAQDNFHYLDQDDEKDFIIAKSGGFEVIERAEPFGFERFHKTWRGRVRKQDGSGWWRWLSLNSGGGSIGVDGIARQRIRYDPEDERLYAMHADVYEPRQTLGLVLGLGALAHHAVDYRPDENIFDLVEWKRPRKWPADISRTSLALE